ncbi:MFS transporter [Vibrio sp. V31_P5A7T61]|uniref:MFS transporter n=1 Tax=unclassified Vibrio TaxID=2614977 RepID=UPI00137348D7|nr:MULTISPECIES: MFS transporter [unclassified Vibrio]EKO3894433.1 MFS transporter [Vibrio metschnikovii]NAW63584.1 MFS transporter [Vibrio sp. V31_P5A7T61]NAW77744.1 MFS transporter [Vibrio sp. V33_P6A3T137]NAX01053.1 MFS transporter [Vibrio sp. V34_P3A8T189]NAX07059.1 MFS transporter [Vibrio sp. V40_P2S30T141]
MFLLKKQSYQLSVIGLSAALMGIGQNGLLVSLPFLVEQSAFDLPTWSILIALGSFLFLPSAPFWGRVSDKHGPKHVVIQALVGMAVSFFLLALFAMASRESASIFMLCLIGLAVARIIYGCTVSGMVPASQHWAILLCGEQHRLQAITSVSIGLSVGRLLGPVISLLALKASPFAPFLIMVLLPMVALLGTCFLPTPSMLSTDNRLPASLPWFPSRRLWRFLASGLLLCSAISLLQYSFSPLLSAVTKWPTSQISDAIGLLLTISAACTFVTQVMVIKKKKLSPEHMYRLGAGLVVVGFALFLVTQVWVLPLAMVFIACGAALLVPAYTTAATAQYSDAPGAVAGYISMSHTIGYGLASLLAFSATLSPHYPIYLCVLFALLIMWTAFASTSSKSVHAEGRS